jgi:hypothetical protein
MSVRKRVIDSRKDRERKRKENKKEIKFVR